MARESKNQAMAVREPAQELSAYGDFTREQVELIKDTVCRGATDGELRYFLNHCQRLGVDPFARHAFLVGRWDSRERREVKQFQMSVDGLRSIAAKTGRYAGQEGPFWCGKDGVWRDVWVEDTPPVAAKVGVWIVGQAHPTWGVATWREYVQTTKEGGPTSMWKKFGPTMIAKCAETQGLRKAFPFELGGVYTSEEMGQASSGQVVEGEAHEVGEETLVNTALERGYSARILGPDTAVMASPATPPVTMTRAEPDPVSEPIAATVAASTPATPAAAPAPSNGGMSTEVLADKLETVVREATALTAELGIDVPLVADVAGGAEAREYIGAIMQQSRNTIAALESFLDARDVARPTAAEGAPAAAVKAHRDRLIELARANASLPVPQPVDPADIPI